MSAAVPRENDSEPARSFERRFGKRIAACGVTPIPTLLIKYGCSESVGLSPLELVYCLLVLDKRWNDAWPFLGNSEAAEALGCSSRHIAALKASLRDKGLARFSESAKSNGRRGADIVDLSPLLACLEERVAEADRTTRSIRHMVRRRGASRLPDLPEERAWAPRAMNHSSPLNGVSHEPQFTPSHELQFTPQTQDSNSGAMNHSSYQEERKQNPSYSEGRAAARDEGFSSFFAPAVGGADAPQAEARNGLVVHLDCTLCDEWLNHGGERCSIHRCRACGLRPLANRLPDLWVCEQCPPREVRP